MSNITKLDALPDWAQTKPGRPTRYPWLDLKEVGMMFEVSSAARNGISALSFRNQVYLAGKRYGMKLRMREREDGAFEVVRIA